MIKKVFKSQNSTTECLPDTRTRELMKDMLGALNEARVQTKKEKERAEMYLQIAGVMLTALDERGRVIMINKKGCEILGHKEKDILGKDWFENFLPVSTRKQVRVVFKKIISGQIKAVEFFENKILNAKGEERLIVWHNAVLKDDQGKIFSILSSGEDITKEKENENLLRESEEKFHYVFDNSPVGMSLTLLDGRINTNQALNKMLGYSRAEMVGKKWQDITHPDDIRLTETNISSLKAGKRKIAKFVKRFFHKNGSLVWVELTSFLRRDETNQPLYLISVLVDITKRKQDEEKLRESEEKFSAAFHASPSLIAVTRIADGKILEVNEGYSRLLGYSRAESVGKTTAELAIWVNPADRLTFTSRLKKIGRVDNFEIKLRRKDGTVITVIDSARTMKLLGEKCILSIAYDITERKKMELSLKESEEKYSNLVEKSNDGIVLIQNGKITFLNQNMSKMMGFSVKEGLDQNFLDFVAPEDRKLVYEKYVARLQGKKVETRYEFNLIDKNKNKLPIEANVSLVNFGEQVGIMAVIRDMTKAKENEKIKSEFVSVTSHQMRTPLTGIKWFTELLLTKKAGTLSDKQIDYLQQVQISNERMIKLVDDLLSVSRMESTEKFKVSIKPEDVIKIFHQVIDGEKVISDKKNIKIIHEGKCLESFVANVDREKFYLVLQNILDNAVKYSPNNSTVSVRCRPEKTNLIFSITDCGIGIPKKQQHRMFERFFRADNVISTQPGTGLGLYIAKYIVEKHNGKIWFESEEGKGTTFYVSLPIK